MVKPVLIDCDPGIDDALALLFAFASPEIKVDAVTAVYGNTVLSNTLKNILKIIKIAGIVPFPCVGKGCSKPLKARRLKQRYAHGRDGLADTNLDIGDLKINIKSGVNLIIEKTFGNKVESIIALGPLTNIASAILQEPKIKEQIKELIIMGGALYPLGSFNSEIEFNIGCDPEAAKVVFHSGIPIKLISLDLTRKVMFKEKHLKPFIKLDNPLSNFITRITEFYIDFNKTVRKKEGAFLNDPVAVGVALNQHLGNFENLCIDVKLKGERGKLFLTKGRANISFCKSIDVDKFLKLFVNRLLNYCKRRSAI